MATATEVLTAQVAASRCASKAVPRLASLPELRTYNCKPCGVTVTEAEEPRERCDTITPLDHPQPQHECSDHQPGYFRQELLAAIGCTGDRGSGSNRSCCDVHLVTSEPYSTS
jgi:hypothetical protein